MSAHSTTTSEGRKEWSADSACKMASRATSTWRSAPTQPWSETLASTAPRSTRAPRIDDRSADSDDGEAASSGRTTSMDVERRSGSCASSMAVSELDEPHESRSPWAERRFVARLGGVGDQRGEAPSVEKNHSADGATRWTHTSLT